jgi:RNA polymerase sigma-70 factor, ECF subfamily
MPGIGESSGGGAAAGGRANSDWVDCLRSTGPEAEAAERDLRGILVGGLRRALGRRVDADTCQDFAQDAMIRIRAGLDGFRGESRFTTWALSIAIRVAFDELRHRRWKDVSFEALTDGARGPTRFEPRQEASQERTLARERVLAELRAVIDGELTEKQRRVLMAELEGMPQGEIALHLKMNRNALYKLSHDARRKVKARMERAGLTGADVLWVFE